jgi:geranylgeranyl pyrophosphate synthase
MSDETFPSLDWTRRWLDPARYRLGGRGSLPGLEKTIDETVMSGGKRLRPILMAEMAALFGVPVSEIEPLARAAEQVHSATLAHDDVIDASDTRRGLDTLNARLENRRAVLGGDYLLAEGIFTVTRQKNFAVIESLAVTLKELVTGEILQNEARGKIEVDSAHLARIADLKTGSLFRWCCSVPAELAGADEETLRLVREFATRLGIAFQLIDDAIDLSPDTGKPPGQDLREGLLNTVTLELVRSHPETRRVVADILTGAREFTVPWSDPEIASAERTIRRMAAERLVSSRFFFADLISRIPLPRLEASREAAARIGFLIDRLEKRSH